MNQSITINPSIVESKKLTNPEDIGLLYYYFNPSITNIIPLLIEKGLISKKYKEGKWLENNYFITTKGKELIEGIVLESEKGNSSSEELIIQLAEELRNMFPEGKKQGTNYYWRDNNPSIVKRLKVFFKKYGKYSAEDIKLATAKYIKSFNGTYSYMQLLKYFIWKNKPDGSEDSELLTYLENLSDNEESDGFNLSDWTATLK